MNAISKIFVLVLLSSGLVACSNDDSSKSPAGEGDLADQVSRENYLSGQKFCARYADLTSLEHGVLIQVPVNYSDPSQGTTGLYAWTPEVFDPKKPSFIYIDGGPGGNSHGDSSISNSAFNEIHYDQRGLGCSAPESFDLYQNSSFYSSINTIQDMDLIRKAYGISKWSVYGISYGTVPATMYGSKFPKSTISVILEGVMYRGRDIQSGSFKAQKFNLMLEQLAAGPRQGLDKAMRSGDSLKIQMLYSIMSSAFYVNNGYRRMAALLTKLISDSGEINWTALKELYGNKTGKAFGHPQAPGNVDAFVNQNLFCKEFEMRNLSAAGVRYSLTGRNFIESLTSPSRLDSDCNAVGVRASDERTYIASEYPVNVPVYYFQGSHDAATQAKGALKHYQTTPTGQATFLLQQKGGHSPNFEFLASKKPEIQLIRSAQRLLFRKAVLAQTISRKDVAIANVDHATGEEWLFIDQQSQSIDFDRELEGIRPQIPKNF